MDEVGVVVAIVNALNAAGLPYMLVGSLSSNAYGICRRWKRSVGKGCAFGWRPCAVVARERA